MLKKACLLFIVLNLIPHFVLAETIDVNIKGVDDGVKTTIPSLRLCIARLYGDFLLIRQIRLKR